ncbi:MAG: hypothetical protein IPF92_15740 [Myxococcales bacterium]|nr:hypothetical protein [Myxococcales bacterium]
MGRAPEEDIGFDVLTPMLRGSMKLLAIVTDPKSVARYLRGIGEPTDVPQRTPARGPPVLAESRASARCRQRRGC